MRQRIMQTKLLFCWWMLRNVLLIREIRHTLLTWNNVINGNFQLFAPTVST